MKPSFSAYLVLHLFFLMLFALPVSAQNRDLYPYEVKQGDTLGGIAVMFSGSEDYKTIARSNRIADPDVIHPGDLIMISPGRPADRLRGYLETIYKRDLEKAYQYLSKDSRKRLSFTGFESALESVTVFDLSTIRLCSDFMKDGRHIAQLVISLKEDPASWGFNLAWENGRWGVLVYDAFPAFPHYEGHIGWECPPDN